MTEKKTESKNKKGLLLVFTGDGKGKTTAAIGMTMRAVGHGMRICFIQFIKGSWKYGEMKAIARFPEYIDFHVMGCGFTWNSDNLDKDRAVAKKAWNKAKEAISSGVYDMVVLDEFTYLPNYKMIDLQEALEVLGNKPDHLHLVITGRNADPALLEIADLITEMQEIKHPYKQGIKAQKGVEF